MRQKIDLAETQGEKQKFQGKQGGKTTSACGTSASGGQHSTSLSEIQSLAKRLKLER